MLDPQWRESMDILRPFNSSSKGNKYILAMDQITKWLECVPLPDQFAEKLAMSAVDEFFCRFRLPFIQTKVVTLLVMCLN